MSNDHTAIFLDTTIQMLRFVGSSDVKAQIRRQLSGYGITITSLVVRQEFKRRFLTDVRYLKTALEKNRFDREATLRYLNEKLSLPVNRRKLSVCLEVFSTGAFNGRSIKDSGEKFHLLLSNWEASGLDLFDQSIGQVVRYSGCGCGMAQQLGPQKCSVVKNCKINDFIQSRRDPASGILRFLSNNFRLAKTKEILKAERSLNQWLNTGTAPDADNPCLTVGDLIIALESGGIPVFYTKNARESQFFCNALSQTMVVLRDSGDEIRAAEDRNAWPQYS